MSMVRIKVYQTIKRNIVYKLKLVIQDGRKKRKKLKQSKTAHRSFL